MLRDVLVEEVIEIGSEARTWREVIRKSGELLVKQNFIDAGYVKEMMNTVEEYGPYMILVPEVAFFHGPPSSLVHQVCMSLITLKHEVYFEEFGNQKITCAFAFGAQDKESHMEILVELAELLQNDKFLYLVRNNGSKEEILHIIENY